MFTYVALLTCVLRCAAHFVLRYVDSNVATCECVLVTCIYLLVTFTISNSN